MLQSHKVSKRYGSKEILSEISFTLNRGDRALLLGPNGCGKTTLLRIIAGEEVPDGGAVSIDSRAMLGYLPQGFDLALDQSVNRAIFSGIPGYLDARQEVEGLLALMEGASQAEIDGLLSRYASALEAFQSLGGYDFEEQAVATLGHLGLSVPLETPLARLSGGERTRVGLARLLIARPDILLLDEPTNHLDIDALEWLEEFLVSYPGAILMVSHDEAFIDQVANMIIAIDAETHLAAVFSGGYQQYMAARETALEKQWAQWSDQIDEERRMKAAINRIQQHANKYEHISKNDFQRGKAKVIMQKAMAQKTRLERDLNAVDRVEKPKAGWTMDLDFGESPRGGQDAIRLEGVGHAFPGGDFLFRDVTLTLRHGERIALIGPNGSGKSTLLRIIMGDLVPTEGRAERGPSVQVGYMPQGQAGLSLTTTPLEIIRQAAPLDETAARRFLHRFLFSGDEVFTRIGDLSYGQRARLILAGIVLGGANCLLLDEPSNHLDIPSRHNFLVALEAFPGPVLVATHDRAFIDRFATAVWVMTDGGIHVYPDRAMMTERPKRRPQVS